MLIEINPDHPEPRKIRRAVDALEAGEVIAYPTDTVYGLGCDLFNKKAVDRLYQIKGIDRSHMLAFVCQDLADVSKYAVMHNDVYRTLKQFSARARTASSWKPPARCRGSCRSNRKTVGVRIPQAPGGARICARSSGGPSSPAPRRATASRATPTRATSTTSFPGLALVLDAGPGGTEPTTVIDLTLNPPTIVRRGAGDVGPFER